METGTRKTVRSRNLSIEINPTNARSSAGGISQTRVPPELITNTEITRKVMLRINAIKTLVLFLKPIRYFDLLFIPDNRV
jgi:hypothetical protein